MTELYGSWGVGGGGGKNVRMKLIEWCGLVAKMNGI